MLTSISWRFKDQVPKLKVINILGIDTDKNKYPIGSGRVTFDNVRSYVRAISAAYVEIRTDKFTKKVGSVVINLKGSTALPHLLIIIYTFQF